MRIEQRLVYAGDYTPVGCGLLLWCGSKIPGGWKGQFRLSSLMQARAGIAEYSLPYEVGSSYWNSNSSRIKKKIPGKLYSGVRISPEVPGRSQPLALRMIEVQIASQIETCEAS